MSGQPGRSGGHNSMGRELAGGGLYAEQMPGDPWPWERDDEGRKWTVGEMLDVVVERTTRWGLLRTGDQREYVRHMADHHFLRWKALRAIDAGIMEVAGVNAIELLQKSDRQIIAAYRSLRDSSASRDPRAEAKAIRDLFSGADAE